MLNTTHQGNNNNVHSSSNNDLCVYSTLCGLAQLVNGENGSVAKVIRGSIPCWSAFAIGHSNFVFIQRRRRRRRRRRRFGSTRISKSATRP